MDLKIIWSDLKSALRSSVGLTSDSTDDSQDKRYLNNHVLTWQRASLPAVNSTNKRPVHEDDCETGYPFHSTWNPGPEYLWLTELYRLGLNIKHSTSLSSYTWEGTITVDTAASTDRRDESHVDFIAARLPHEIVVSGVMVGGNTSSLPYDLERARLAYTLPLSVAARVVLPTTFCALHKLQDLNKHDNSQCRAVHGSMKAALADRSVQPLSSVRLQTTSNCTYLAVETSRAVVRLLTIPAKPADPSPTDIIRVICQARTFSASLSRLTSVSAVMAACFHSDSFIESKARQFDLSAFSEVTVEAFLQFCTHGSVPQQTRTVCVELAQLSHQYEVKALLVMCEIFLMRELIFCGSVTRLCELTRVAVRLELPLLLATFDVVLAERQRDWMWAKEALLRLEPWAAVMEELPSFESARLRAVLLLDGLELGDDGTVIRPEVGKRDEPKPTAAPARNSKKKRAK